MASRRQFIRSLTSTLLNGPWLREPMLHRCEQLLGGPAGWLTPLLSEVFSRFPAAPSPSPAALSRLIGDSPSFAAAWDDRERRPGAYKLPLNSNVQEPPPPWLSAAITQLPHSAAVAGWLVLSLGQLDWLADGSGRQRLLGVDDSALRHYHYHWIPKRRGPPRLLEAPKSRLKAIQRRLLDEILHAVPPHPAAHGFRRGHDCISFARPHCDQALVLRLDLQDFFPTVRASRIHALFRLLGYPWKVARLLTGLCCNAVPADILSRQGLGLKLDWPSRQRYATPHLPQGAPTSPALANLAAFALDRRLAGLAANNGMTYSRYADDLALSGNKVSDGRARHLAAVIAAIALEEGFSVNHHKTALMRADSRQRLTGISVNCGINIPRRYFDQLKATLFNCARFGPASQNHQQHPQFRAQLLGRIAHVAALNPDRSDRLRALFNTIAWPDEP